MKQYIVYIDYLSGNQKEYEYLPVQAVSLGEAMMEADSIWNPETMYLTRVLAPVGRWQKENKNWRRKLYKAICCKRSCRWYPNDSEHSEYSHYAFYHENTDSNVKLSYTEACSEQEAMR